MAPPVHPNFPRPLFFLIPFLLLLHVLPPASSETENVILAIFLPKTGAQRVGPEAEAAVNWTIGRLNRQLEDRFLFQYHTVDTRCNKDVALTEFFRMMCQHSSQVHAVIGPACDEVCQVVGTLAAGERPLPVISNGCSSPELSDRTQYPTFLRTSSSFSEMQKVLRSVFQAFNWTRITIVHGNGTVWLETADEFGDALKHSGFHIRQLSIRHPETLEQDLLYESTKTRVFLLLAYDADIVRFMRMAEVLEMRNGVYAFVTVNFANSAKAHANMTYYHFLDGLLDVTLHVSPDSALYQEFIAEVLAHTHVTTTTTTTTTTISSSSSSSSAFSFSPPPPTYSQCSTNYEMAIQAALLSDAIMLYAQALNASLSAQDNLNDTVHLVQHLFGTSFVGVSGNLTFDLNGQRYPHFMVHNIQGGCYVPVAVCDEELTFLNITVVWPGGALKVPVDSPHCGWWNEQCLDQDKTTEIVIGSCFAVLAAVVGILLAVYFVRVSRKRSEKMMKSQNWKLAFRDLKKPRHRGSVNFSTQEDGHEGSTVSIESTDSMRSTVQRTDGLYYYNGQVVKVKTVQKVFGVTPTASLCKELNQIRHLDNRNINPFIGACAERGHVCIVSAYCRKGSLFDLIHKSDLDFDCMFISSLSYDISRGLHYLHNSVVGYHSRLKSRNVFVDSTFTCKIGDIHMPNLREGEAPDVRSQYYRTRLLWSAPEVATGEIYREMKDEKEEIQKTRWQRADMWSLGVILYEILFRKKPFPALHDSDPEEAVRKLQSNCRPDEGGGDMLQEIRQRPHHSLNAQKYHMKVIELLGLCWESSPELRVTSGDVSKRLRDYGKEHCVLHTNFYQNMLHMMTKNEEDLERQVRERTLQLETEKNHTKRLLNEMLPVVVADQLLIGVTPPPEYFDCVTVFFSDIVHFTQLAASCTPLEVMAIINSLYEYFDHAIDNFNVYKVETIGDAYMVASGLPQRNGDQHAGAIADMALALLSGLDTLHIPYRPDYKLQVRVGIHSGPVVAGVVGTKMPRYCLFGDTVNTASRMESHGKPLKIQISKDTKQLLEKTGGFVVRKREDQCIVKGKGEMETYWLAGRDATRCAESPRPHHLPSLTRTPTTPTPPVIAHPTPPPSPLLTRGLTTTTTIRIRATDITPSPLSPSILLDAYPSPAPSVNSIPSTPCVNNVTPVSAAPSQGSTHESAGMSRDPENGGSTATSNTTATVTLNNITTANHLCASSPAVIPKSGINTGSNKVGSSAAESRPGVHITVLNI